jgi:3-oxoacyl-[acyl-carrier protein] reductase
VHEFPVESWLRVVDVNLNGTLYCCRTGLPFMLEMGYARIVNLSPVVDRLRRNWTG